MKKIKTSKLSRSISQTDKPHLQNSYLELHIENFDEVEEFYKDIGFETVWRREPEGFNGYMVMKLEENILAFWGGNDEINNHPYFKGYDKNTKPGYRVELVMFVKDLDIVYEKCKSLNAIFEDIYKWPWGMRDFRIKDPNGFYVRISEKHNVLSDENAVR